MLTKSAVAGLAVSALLANVAFAQSPSATTDSATTAAPAAASDTSSFKGNWRASKLVGLNVYNDSNESLGSINDLLTEKGGNIKAVVIGVGGTLDVLAGIKHNCPLWIRTIGLEWMYRIVEDPRGKFKRYSKALPWFVWALLIKGILSRLFPTQNVAEN